MVKPRYRMSTLKIVCEITKCSNFRSTVQFLAHDVGILKALSGDKITTEPPSALVYPSRAVVRLYAVADIWARISVTSVRLRFLWLPVSTIRYLHKGESTKATVGNVGALIKHAFVWHVTQLCLLVDFVSNLKGFFHRYDDMLV